MLENLSTVPILHFINFIVYLMRQSITQTIKLRMIGRLMNNEIGWMCKKTVVAQLRFFPSIYLKGLREIAINLSI
jgi:hypothetical protein